MFMKCIAIVWVLFVPVLVSAQEFTIGDLSGTTLYIGMDNVLEFGASDKQSIAQVKSDGLARVSKEDDHFILHVSKPSDLIWVRSYSKEKNMIDSIKFKSKRVNFRQFVKVKNSGLIVSGEYTKATLRNLESVIMNLNVPWIETPVIKFKIEIYQNELLFSGVQKGARLDSPAIQKAISKLTRGGVVRISQIRARLAGDDGPQPIDMIFTCK